MDDDDEAHEVARIAWIARTHMQIVLREPMAICAWCGRLQTAHVVEVIIHGIGSLNHKFMDLCKN